VDKISLKYHLIADAFKEFTTINFRLESVLEPTESYITELSPVIGAHIGPGMVGMAWWKYPISAER
jgi:fatty acid-binding protein DegV